MALTNAQKQARYRERHIGKHRRAARIANLLMRKRLTDEVIEDIAGLLSSFFNREGVRMLRRRLRELTDSKVAPPPSRLDIAEIAAMGDGEKQAYERDHPGQEYPEYECNLTPREYTDLWRWRRQRGRQALRGQQA